MTRLFFMGKGIFKDFERQKYIIIFYMGILLGSMCMNLFCEVFYDRLGIYSSYIIESYKNINVDRMNLFYYAVKTNIFEIVLVLGMSLTSMGKTVLCGYVFFRGAIIALMLSSAVIKYGIGGVVIYLISIFPHYIPYMIQLVFVVWVAEYFIEKSEKYRKLGMSEGGVVNNIIGMICDILKNKRLIPLIVVLVLMSVLKSFLESYVNIQIIKSFL